MKIYSPRAILLPTMHGHSLPWHDHLPIKDIQQPAANLNYCPNTRNNPAKKLNIGAKSTNSSTNISDIGTIKTNNAANMADRGAKIADIRSRQTDNPSKAKANYAIKYIN